MFADKVMKILCIEFGNKLNDIKNKKTTINCTVQLTY